MWDLPYSSTDLQIASMFFYIRFIPQVQRHPNLVPSFQRLDEEQQDLILNNLKAPQKFRGPGKPVALNFHQLYP